MKTPIKSVIVFCIFNSVLCTQSNAQSWDITGNAGTTGSNFIGTTDNVAFNIRTKNKVRLTVNNSGKVGIGTAPAFKLDVSGGSINTDSVYRIGGNTVLSIKGNANTFVGNNSGYSNTGSWNSSLGSYALSANTTGYANAAFGETALVTNTEGYENAAMGASSLRNNTSGDGNSAFGTSALRSNTLGNNNTANGMFALYFNTTGSYNTANGREALYVNSTGSSNVANGAYALSYCTGSFNTAIGSSSGNLITSGSKNVTIGAGAQVPSGIASNQVRIGDNLITYAGVQVAWTITSDRRWKADIKETNLGLAFISKLRPVSYYRINDESKKREYGFIAQELEETLNASGAAGNGIISKDDEDMYGVRYNDLMAPMVKAIQELSAKNEAQAIIIESLKSEINNLKSDFKQSENNNRQAKILFQNSPNPFSLETEIKFQLPAQFNSARLVINDESGKQIKTYNVQSSNPIVIKAGELSAGMYSYSLLIDDITVDSKQMILTK